MARDLFINGETTVSAAGSVLGLASDPIVVSLDLKGLDVKSNSFGDVPFEVQFMGGEATIKMTLVHFDRAVVDTIVAKSMGGAAIGQLPRAGTRMGGGGNFFALSLNSPVGSKPWTFPNSYLTGTPIEFPLGAERSLMSLTFRAIPYAADPSTAAGVVLWTYS